MQPVRTLILSGGGGRGAFHAGVYRYLCEIDKPGLDPDHQGRWTPDIVVGTSIGAVNGAAIVQGIAPERLEEIWRGLRENDIQGLPPGMRRLSRWAFNLFLRQFIGVALPKVPTGESTSPPADQSWLPVPHLPAWLCERLLGRWNNLLDTGPLRRTLEGRMGLDPEKIARSEKTLLINATNVRTGERTTFSNRALASRRTGQLRKDIIPGITLQRILASCSIPLVYPWTFDEETAQLYWDGALVANTPLSGALDAAQEWPTEVPMEAVVVIMTPWIEGGQDQSSGAAIDPASLPLPESFSEALTFTLDWALLATFRERLRVTEAYNRLARLGQVMADAGLPAAAPAPAGSAAPYPELPRYREVNVVVVAPERFFPMARIIDYDERTDRLIQLGYAAAQRAFETRFGLQPAQAGQAG
jgi:NTE family protein